MFKGFFPLRSFQVTMDDAASNKFTVLNQHPNFVVCYLLSPFGTLEFTMFSIGNSSLNVPCSLAMSVYWRV